ncbi:ankyrin repeat-containing domain protein [Cladorrhinum sp. PSN259]|nr:ankyrin repeat-containing domain protein [Cladorrhinum sp. PSN259]
MDRTPKFERYTVVWICPQVAVRTAAIRILDDKHGSATIFPDGDDESCVLGVISGFHVIITGIPQPDDGPETWASAIMTRMRASFPNIEFGMLICTGGGVPGNTGNGTIQLGDVVVSRPSDGHSGALLYDAGKAQAGRFECTGYLPKPPESVLAAAEELTAKCNKGENSSLLLEGIMKVGNAGVSHQECYHLSQRQTQHPSIHEVNSNPRIAIHRGTVASGELEIQSAAIRDRLAENYQILSFEMGAARHFQDLPCVVIQGITHHCDSQTSDSVYQDLVAVAVSYGRQLLAHIVSDMEQISSSRELEQAPEEAPGRREEFIDWLTPINFEACQTHHTRMGHLGAGQWLLNFNEYQSWVKGSGQALFLPGAQGSGKTLLASTVVEDLKSRFWADRNVGIAYFYLDSQCREEQKKPEDLLLSLVKQLLQRKRKLPHAIEDDLFSHYTYSDKPRWLEPDWLDVLELLRLTVREFSQVFVVVDALDDCIASCRKAFVRELRKLQARYAVNIFATSRYAADLTGQFHDAVQLDILTADEDLRAFVAENMPRLPSFVRASDVLQAEILSKVVSSANRSFLLAKFSLDSLTRATSAEEVANILGHFDTASGSETYDLAYNVIMDQVMGQTRQRADLARKVLSWLTFATRHLSVSELRHALAVDLGGSNTFTDNQPYITDMISVCGGLATFDPESGIIRLEHRTARSYLRRTRDKYLRGGEDDMGMACVAYLSLEKFERGVCETDRELGMRLQLNPFYAYAAQNWSRHSCEIYPLPKKMIDFITSTPRMMAACQAAMVASLSTGTKFARHSQGFPSKTSALHFAAYAGAKSVIQSFIGDEAAFFEKDGHGHTPLSRAAARGFHSTVELLLRDHHVDINSREHSGRTPLSLAAGDGHARVVETLLRYGANPNLKDVKKGDPLWYATQGRHATVVRLLLGRDLADVNPSISRPNAMQLHGRLEYETPALTAAKQGDVDVVRLLLDQQGINPHAKYKIHFPCEATDSRRFGLSELYRETTALGLSIEQGYEDVVELILKHNGPDPDGESDWSGTKLLFQAAAQGSDRIARLLLTQHAVDPNVRGEWNRTPLMAAAWGGHNSLVQLLLDTEDIDPNVTEKDGNTALSGAAQRGNEVVVSTLLKESNVEPDIKDGNGRTPLSLAAERAHEAVMDRLLKSEGVNADSRDINGRTPLSWATAPEDEWDKEVDHRGAVLQLLTTGRVNPDSRDRDGRTPLSYASAGGQLELIKQLLNHPRVDPNTKDKRGWTPLLWAAAHGHDEVVAYLLDTPTVDVNSRCYTRKTALSYAAANGHEAVVRTLLLNQGINANHKDDFGSTPMAEAAKAGHAAIIKQILLLGKSHEVDPNTQGNGKETPLLIASDRGHDAVVNVLLDAKGIRPELKDTLGRTPLAVAASRGHAEIVKRLVAVDGINPDSKDKEGRTPLSRAAEGAHVGVVRQLLALEGIGVDRRDTRGRSPLSWAIDPGFEPYHLPEGWSGDNMSDRMEVVKRLLRMDAVDPNAIDSEGLTPLIRARGTDSSGEMERLLRSRKDLHRNCHRARAAYGRFRGPTLLSTMVVVDQEADQLSDDMDEIETSSDIASHDAEETEEEEHEGEEHEEDEGLCPRCKKIDLEKELSPLFIDRNRHRTIAKLGKVDETWCQRRCAFCRLIATIRPGIHDAHVSSPNGGISSDDVSFTTDSEFSTTNSNRFRDRRHLLQVVSSTTDWLCQDPHPNLLRRFESPWIDTVFLGVAPGYSSLPNTGYISLVGSNCPEGSRAVTVPMLRADRIDFRVARGWIKCCQKAHYGYQCNPDAIEPVPNLRLIECSTRKIVTPDSAVPFVALSYVWGPPVAVPDRMDHGLVEEAEQVVQDAIRATLALGYSYLWVDRHCIAREDEFVRNEQLNNMHLVYLGAEVTIIAAAGKDSSFGLPGVGPCARVSRPCIPVKGSILTSIPPSPSQIIRSSTWATRAWTYQEGMLARRRLFFTEHELSFECDGMVCREAIKLPPDLQENFHTSNPRLQSKERCFGRIQNIFAAHSYNPDSDAEAMCWMICEYTRRSITYQHDILNAMLGILQRFANLDLPTYHLGGVPIFITHAKIFGLKSSFLEGFIKGLFWKLERYGSRRQGFPSWSWTGWIAPVSSLSYTGNRKLNPEHLAVDVTIIPEEGLPMHWKEYQRLCQAGKMSTIGQCPILEITSPVAMISLRLPEYDEPTSGTDEYRMDAKEWLCTVCAGNDIMEGPFSPAKDPSDTEFERKLHQEEWLGIVVGHYPGGKTYLLIVEEEPAKGYWEHIGTAELHESTLCVDMLERRTIQLR